MNLNQWLVTKRIYINEQRLSGLRAEQEDLFATQHDTGGVYPVWSARLARQIAELETKIKQLREQL